MRHAGYAALLAGVSLAPGCFQEEAPRRDAPAGAAPQTGVEIAVARSSSAPLAESEPSVPEMTEALREAQDPRVRREAVYTLADAVAAEDAAPIGEALTDPDVEVRLAAIQAMTGFDGTMSADWLATGLGDPDPRVRRTAVEALGEIGGESARVLLLQARGDVDPSVREAAEQMLSEPAFAEATVSSSPP